MDFSQLSELEQAARRFGEAWARGDVAELAGLLSPGYTHTDATGELLAHDEWLAYAARRTGRTTSIAFRDVVIRDAAPDVAIITGVNVVTGGGARSAADRADLLLRFTQVWVRRDGRWLREAFQATPIVQERAS